MAPCIATDSRRSWGRCVRALARPYDGSSRMVYERGVLGFKIGRRTRLYDEADLHQDGGLVFRSRMLGPAELEAPNAGRPGRDGASPTRVTEPLPRASWGC